MKRQCLLLKQKLKSSFQWNQPCQIKKVIPQLWNLNFTINCKTILRNATLALGQCANILVLTPLFWNLLY